MNEISAAQTAVIVPPEAIGGMILALVFGICGPLLLLILWRSRKKCTLAPAVIGAATFIIAAMVLENIPKYFLFSGMNPLSAYILNHAWAYALTAALLAGIFEECGRFLAFRFFLKDHTAKETAVTYGIGHGGIECIFLLGFGMFSNLTMAFAINNGTLASMMQSLPAEQLAAYENAVASLTSTTFALFMWSIWERLFAMLFHISLSVLVFVAARNRSRMFLFPLAILLHTGLDIFAALYQFGTLTLPLTELLIALLACGCAFFAYRIYQSLPAGKQ